MNDEPKLPVLQSGGAIRAIIPQTFEEAWRIANAVVKSGMNPRGLDTAEKCTVVIMHGLEVGMPPMMALQSIALINNRPTIFGDGALGLVQGSGKLVTIKEWTEGNGDNLVAICRVMRANDPEPKIGRFSVDDAKTAKLWQKKGRQGEDTPWVTYPERMLKMRARSWVLRDAFADVLKGLAIAEEERDIASGVTSPPKPTPPKPPQKSLSQPIEQSPMPPVAPPKPPKPQMKPVVEEPEEDEPEFIDNDTGEVLTPGELLSELDDALDTAKTEDEIETIWNDYDLEARLESMPQGQEFFGVALGIKRRHLKRVAS